MQAAVSAQQLKAVLQHAFSSILLPAKTGLTASSIATKPMMSFFIVVLKIEVRKSLLAQIAPSFHCRIKRLLPAGASTNAETEAPLPHLKPGLGHRSL
jgi:hypothetical protein